MFFTPVFLPKRILHTAAEVNMSKDKLLYFICCFVWHFPISTLTFRIPCRDKYKYHTCKVLQNTTSGYFSDLMILTATCIGCSPFLNLENTLAENEHKWSLLHQTFPSTLHLGMVNTLTPCFHSIFTYFY